MGNIIGADTLPAVSAGASAVIAELGAVPQYESTDNALENATLVPSATASAQGATNFLTLQIRRLPKAGGSAVVLASLNLGTTALTAETAVSFTLANADYSSLVPGDVLDLYGLQTGTGGALAAGASVSVELE